MSAAVAFKRVLKSFRALKQMEGEGATVYRSIGSPKLPNLDPFILFDDADTRDGQFPDHPHRGQEIVVYMLKGVVKHEDSQGGKGEIVEGGGQWMTAGRGIVHAEKIESNHVHAIAMWVNLRSSKKSLKPGYQQFTNETIKRAKDEKAGISATILAGTALGQTAPTITQTPASFIDFRMKEGARLEHAMNPGWNSMMYILEGKVNFGKSAFAPKDSVILTPEEPALEVHAHQDSRFILISGEPIKEPIVQHGPFVMNTTDEIRQAFDDYYNGQNGFEGAQKWKSQLFYGGR